MVGRANFAIMSVLRWLALANFAKHYILRTLARENRAYQARRPACLRAGTLPTREAQERGSPAPGATAT